MLFHYPPLESNLHSKLERNRSYMKAIYELSRRSPYDNYLHVVSPASTSCGCSVVPSNRVDLVSKELRRFERRVVRYNLYH